MRAFREGRERRLPALTDRLPLGPHGLRVSPVCLGMVGDPGAVVEAFDAGVNFFFVTADMHWPYYENLRRGLALLFERGGGVRDEVVVAAASYVTQPEFCSLPFLETIEALPGLDRIDLLVAGGVYAHEFLPRFRVYERHLAEGHFGAKALGASLHERAAAPTIGRRLVDLVFVRYNAAHRGAEEDVFPFVDGDFPALLYNFKTTSGSVSPKKLEQLGLDPENWRPDITDYYRFALSAPQLDGVLCGFDRREYVRALADALARGPLSDDERQYIADLVDVAEGDAVLNRAPGAEGDAALNRAAGAAGVPS